MWKEKKEKKKVGGDRHIKGCGSQIFKSRSMWKDHGVKFGEIIELYKTLLLSNFQEKKNVLWELWAFEDSMLDLVF